MKDRLKLVREELADTAMVLEGLSCRLQHLGPAYKTTAKELRLQAVTAARICSRLGRGDPDKRISTGLLALVDAPDTE